MSMRKYLDVTTWPKGHYSPKSEDLYELVKACAEHAKDQKPQEAIYTAAIDAAMAGYACGFATGQRSVKNEKKRTRKDKAEK